MFFLVTLRDAMPSLWRSIWRTASIPLLDRRLLNLGNAVRTKCLRCLEARDELAHLFYARDGSGDRSSYHFGYAVLLLSGALDALAKFAFLVYESPASKDFEKRKRRASFHRTDFRAFLNQRGLSEVTGADFESFLELVWRPRDRIHAEEYQAFRRSRGYGGLQPLIEVGEEDQPVICASARTLGGLDRFGLDDLAGRLSIDPYVYVTAILKLGFQYIERISNSIDFSRHQGYDESLDREPPAASRDDVFSVDTLRRVRCLAALDGALFATAGPETGIGS